MRATSALLILFCGLLVAASGILVLQIRTDLTAEPTLPASAADAPAAVVRTPDLPGPDQTAAFVIPPLETYGEILERPLFSMERRAVRQLPSSSSATGNLDATLIGIISTNTKSLVLMRLDDSGEVIQLLEGDRIKGWMLVSVSQERAIFESGGEEVTLELAFETQLEWESPPQTDTDEDEPEVSAARNDEARIQTQDEE